MCRYSQNRFVPSGDRMRTSNFPAFSNNLSHRVTLEMGSRSSKSNQHFPPPNDKFVLAKVHPFIKEIECRQKATLTPAGYALKTICPPPHPQPAMVGDIMNIISNTCALGVIAAIFYKGDKFCDYLLSCTAIPS